MVISVGYLYPILTITPTNLVPYATVSRLDFTGE